jgi:hypothetical protein
MQWILAKKQYTCTCKIAAFICCNVGDVKEQVRGMSQSRYVVNAQHVNDLKLEVKNPDVCLGSTVSTQIA